MIDGSMKKRRRVVGAMDIEVQTRGAHPSNHAAPPAAKISSLSAADSQRSGGAPSVAAASRTRGAVGLS
ncbi:unnamed protein product [Lampetra fluviatilis]